MEVGKQFVAGTASGICLVVVGFPWDTLKVKMQVQRGGEQSLLQTIKTTLKESGVRGLYFGVSAPLVFTGLVNTMLWGFQFNLVRLISSNPNLPPKTIDVMKASLVSGILITSVVTPMELVKSKLQVGNGSRGPIQVAREIYQIGGLSGLYRGAVGVALVRSSNWSYFGMYSLLQHQLTNSQWAPQSRQWNAILAGGSAGICFWLVAFGFDTVKAKMMVDSTSGLGFLGTAQKIHHEFGWRGFYRGLAPCLIRAFPANAAAFWGFETTMKML
ncbi:hypothetical protein BASA81_004791 [Batrachochytrium salamandrivorans]|nr:hypothetical protein BASA81_004791 [Batrachochytrium salamandrivorans]